MDASPVRERRLLPALFLVALATVMFEILLTRIFSLTLWYHFAFMAISIAMFGLTVGALLVFLRPGWWPQAGLARAMGMCAVFLALAMAVVVFLHISLYTPLPHIDMVPMVLTFIVVSVPFVFSGIFVCLALTRFPSRIGWLYAADLGGAAAGCLAVIATLRWLDGVGAVLACAALGCAAAVFLLAGARRATALALTVLLAGTATWTGIYLARNEVAFFKIQHIKGHEEPPVEYERWNSFSRIAVLPPTGLGAQAWNLSTEFKDPRVPIESRYLHIDGHAGTQLIGFDGDLKKIDFLRWDLPNFVQHLRPNGRLAVVGAGGARDVLTAQLFGQKRVVAVEINGDIMRVVNGRFGDFTGHVDRLPGVTFVNDEARSYLARSKERFDVVVVTFVDTFAATAAGAYALTENSLYTVEGWNVFLDRLDDDGLLAVSRAVSPELGRLVALGRAALLQRGVKEPERHLLLVTNRHYTKLSVYPMGVLIVRKTPFGPAELERVHALARELNFAIEVEPGRAATPLLRALATGEDPQRVEASGLNYAAPTDDQPFFFYMARASDWLRLGGGGSSPVSAAAVVLAVLLFTVTGLTLVCIALPLLLARIRLARGDRALLGYFAAIGMGFMLIEVSMLQRLIVFLGHPVYSLTVILFVLLLSGGLGSYLSSRIGDERLRRDGLRVLAVLAAVLVAAGFAVRPLVTSFAAAETPVRIAASAALLAGMGLFLGMAFPLGMRLATSARPQLAPWLWGVNGATSVLASVLAVVIAMLAGISASFWTGVASYVLALAAFAAAGRGYASLCSRA
jgi:hypothetical protein